MKYIKWSFILVFIGIVVIALTEIISYLNNPESYMLGSEAMIGNGGLYYKSKTIFLLINSIQITLSIFAIILFLKVKKTVGFVTAIFIMLLQISIFIIT